MPIIVQNSHIGKNDQSDTKNFKSQDKSSEKPKKKMETSFTR